MNTGSIVRHALAFHGVTQKQLAKDIEVSPQRIHQICNKPSCNSLILDKIAKSLNIKTSSLIMLGESLESKELGITVEELNKRRM